MRTLLSVVFLSLVMVSAALGQSLKCDTSQYKASSGLTAAIDQDALVVTWAGQGGSEVRARYAIQNGQPVVRELAVRKQGGQWATLVRISRRSTTLSADCAGCQATMSARFPRPASH